jgi:hypothetical protein
MSTGAFTRTGTLGAITNRNMIMTELSASFVD